MRDPLEQQLKETLAATHAIERELGGGGMSRVFLASELRFHRKVVIKVLSPALAAGVSAERFEREIAVAANLQHANIVPVLTAGEAAGLPFFTMPFIDGESLRARLRRGNLSRGEIKGILTDVLKALACAHSQGVVHRDIKPENILLSGGAATVTDFGVAKALSVSKHSLPGEGLTEIGSSLGTPGYMAPEQAIGGDVDARSDLYAWGVIAYEMIAGRHPFADSKGAQQMITAHLSENPKPLAGSAPASSALRNVVMRCLAKDPAARPAGAPEILRLISLGAAASPVRIAAVAAGILLGAGLIAGAAFAFVPQEKIATAIALARRKPARLHSDRIIVAPFSNETGDPSLTPLGSMAADWIAQGLARVGSLNVVDSRTVEVTAEIVRHIPWPWRGRDRSRALAEETGSGMLVSGRFYRDGSTLRFQANVVDVTDGKLLWALSPVSGPLSSPTTVLDDLRRRIVASVAQTSDTTSEALSAFSQPPSFEAYTEFRKGFEGLFSRSGAAYSHLLRAAALDTAYVTPWVMLAVGAEDRGDMVVMDSALRRAKAMSERMTPVERAAIEYVDAKREGDRAATLSAARTMFQLTPGSSESPLFLATAALYNRKPHAALSALAGVDPDRGLNLAGSYFWKNRANAYYQLGQYALTLDDCRSGLSRFPSDYFLAYTSISSLVRLGRVYELTAQIEKFGGSEAEKTLLAAHAVEMLGEAGRTAEARSVAEEWLGRGAGEVATGDAGMARAALLMAAGKWEAARSLLVRIAAGDNTRARASILGALGITYANLGQRPEARRVESILAELTESQKGTEPDTRRIGELEIIRARILAQLGEAGRAVVLAQRGRDHGWEMISVRNSFADDHWLAPLRSQPSFRALTSLGD